MRVDYGYTYINDLILRYPQLTCCKERILDAINLIRQSYDEGGKILTVGNGGSSSDSDHITAELMKGFKKKRPISDRLKHALIDIDRERGELLADNLEGTLRSISLSAHSALMTAYMNDKDAKAVYAQQLLGYGDKGDVLIAISTSGNSENIINAAILARALGIHVIALTGMRRGLLEKYSDVVIAVPEKETYLIQELHLPIYHCICLALEEAFFNA